METAQYQMSLHDRSLVEGREEHKLKPHSIEWTILDDLGMKGLERAERVLMWLSSSWLG